GHVWREFPEQISSGHYPELERSPLPRMSDIVEPRRQICVAHKSTGRGPDEIRHSRHPVPRVGAIDEGESHRVPAPANWVVTGRGFVARIFPHHRSGQETCSLKADTFGDCISIVSTEGLGSLAPLSGIFSCSLSWRVCHPDPCLNRRLNQSAGVHVCRFYVPLKLIARVQYRLSWRCRMKINGIGSR